MKDCIFPMALSLVYGPKKCRAILEVVNDDDALRARSLAPDDWDARLANAEALLVRQKEMGITSLPWGSTHYPSLLREIPDPPTVLHVKGSLPDMRRSLAVVGTRRPTPQGKLNTAFWIESLAGTGACVVSGLAMGVDAEAHRAAMRHGLPTVAVLAHGLDEVHPRKNTGLAREIVSAGGALVSEHPIGRAPTQGAFPQRNRIIAGLSQATLVVEAAIKSGAGITANMAFQYHREVLAIPGRPSDVMAQGCLDLVARQVAQMCVHPSQMVEALGWESQARSKVAERNPTLQQVVGAMLGGGKRLPDLVSATGLSDQQILEALGELIWQGRIHVQSGTYALKSK